MVDIKPLRDSSELAAKKHKKNNPGVCDWRKFQGNGKEKTVNWDGWEAYAILRNLKNFPAIWEDC